MCTPCHLSQSDSLPVSLVKDDNFACGVYSCLPCVNLRAEASIKYSVSCSPASSQCTRDRWRYIGSTFSTAEGMLKTISLYEFRSLTAYLFYCESWVGNCQISPLLTSHMLSCFFDLSFPPKFAKDLTREVMVAVDNDQNDLRICFVQLTTRAAVTAWHALSAFDWGFYLSCAMHNINIATAGPTAVSRLIYYMRPMHAPMSQCSCIRTTAWIMGSTQYPLVV